MTGPTVPGAQAERTTLAWTRTSFTFLVNGVLLALKDVHAAGQRAGALIPAAVACAAALTTYVIARRRQHTLAQRPLPTLITARREVYIVAIAALMLVITTAIAQLL